MTDFRDNHSKEKDAILKDLLVILNDVTPGWETGFAGTIRLETRLGADLAFESIHLVRLALPSKSGSGDRNCPFKNFSSVMMGRR